MTTKVLTLDEAQAFLTKSDLQKLEAGIADGTLLADLIDQEPVVIVRKQPIALFTVMQLIGTL